MCIKHKDRYMKIVKVSLDSLRKILRPLQLIKKGNLKD